MYIKSFITQDDIERAKTELLYAIACARQSGAELLCIFINTKSEKEKGKITTECLKILKRMKKENKITLYLTNETFLVPGVEREYLLNKHPDIGEDALLLSPDTTYIIIRL